MTKTIGEGTAEGLIDYLDMLIEKGKASSGAIVPLKTAFTKILLAVDVVQWKQVKMESMTLTITYSVLEYLHVEHTPTKVLLLINHVFFV